MKKNKAWQPLHLSRRLQRPKVGTRKRRLARKNVCLRRKVAERVIVDKRRAVAVAGHTLPRENDCRLPGQLTALLCPASAAKRCVVILNDI